MQVTHPKTDEQRQRLQEACRDILLFKNLDPVSGLFHKHSVLLWFVLCHLLNYTKENMAWGQERFATAQCTMHDYWRWLFLRSWNGTLSAFCRIVSTIFDWYFTPSQEEMSQVLDAMFEKFCTEGEHIIDQDDDGDNFYVIERWLTKSLKSTYASNMAAMCSNVLYFTSIFFRSVGHLTFSWRLMARTSW